MNSDYLEIYPPEDDRDAIVTIKELAADKRYPWLNESKLRHLIFEADERFSASGKLLPGNGLASAILRVGRRVLLDKKKFDDWLKSHNQS